MEIVSSLFFRFSVGRFIALFSLSLSERESYAQAFMTSNSNARDLHMTTTNTNDMQMHIEFMHASGLIFLLSVL